MSTTVTLASQKIPFVVRRITQGDRYGLRDQLVHDKKDPMIEFFDASQPGEGPHASLGNFASRYYESTLLHDEQRLTEYGLNLDGRISSWSIDPAGMKEVYAWIRSQHVDESVDTPLVTRPDRPRG